ncbi:MAG: Nre family DNA repair protein [Candidatus Aenigmarchaeota archaeon]|nr:Nre family DNA repair protein [Candidatus Aenigmarchaeota archaeon]
MMNVWLSKLIDNGNVLRELDTQDIKTVERDFRCILCKGSRLLCGKVRCPILVRLYAQVKIKPFIEGTEIEGSTPPDIFIGRVGYPYVYIGPLIPPLKGDTSILSCPEFWHGKSIDEIVNLRFQLVRGKYRTHVKNFEGKIVELTREIALSKSSVESEAYFTKKPSGTLVLDDEVQPFGPSAPLKNLFVSSIKTDQKIEKAYSDTDLKASEAVFWLYEKGVLISRIQRAFSAGLFGIEKNRKLVPTKWSITAVDSIISQKLLEQVKTFPFINEFRVYEHEALDNKWIVLMIPYYWSYEQMEGWYPGTTWNPKGKNVWIISDWESFKGRTTYALTGGCYYSTRLSVAEQLVKERRQATVITFREIHPGYLMPVGVWHTRESIREAVKKKSMHFPTLDGALKYINSKLTIPLKNWIENSTLLKNLLYQKKVLEFLKKEKL